MERLIVCLLLIFSLELEAQWELTFDGFRDEGKSYMVLDAEGNQKELYERARDYLYSLYVSPKEVLSENATQSINIKGFEERLIYRNKSHAFDIYYGLLVEFKDNRYRVIITSYRMISSFGQQQELHLVYGSDLTGTDLGIYSPKGKLKSKQAKADLERFFNAWTLGLVEYMNGEGDDW